MFSIAVTWLKPLHVGKGRSLQKALFQITDYGKNKDKTENGEWVTGYHCDPMTVDIEWLLSKQAYFTSTGRKREDDVIVYHAMQSFPAGEISALEANQIGQELAKAFSKENHAFIVCTHTDKDHYHNHIYINSVSLDHSREFRNFKNSAWALRRVSDKICLEHGLSIIQEPKPSRGLREKWQAEKEPSYQEKLRWAVDEVLSTKPHSFEQFLVALQGKGYKIKRGKHTAVFAPGQKRATRLDTLKGDYTDEAIRERIAGTRENPPMRPRFGKAFQSPKLDRLIDIPSKIREGKGAGYERWAKVHNLKALSKALLYLQENGLVDYNDLETKLAQSKTTLYDSTQKGNQLQEQLDRNSGLQKQIVNYSKTKDTYVAYRKAGYSKKFLAEHESEIILHKAAKKVFDDFSKAGRKVPSIATLKKEYGELLSEKKAVYAEQQSAKEEMKRLLSAKAIIDEILKEQERENEENEKNHSSNKER